MAVPTSGDDTLTDTSGNDIIDALEGNDQVTVTAGQDLVDGGPGTDTLIVDYSGNPSGQIVTSISGNGSGEYSGFYTDSQDASHRVDFTAFERFNITTAAGVDSITTGDGDDIVDGRGGNDNIATGGGNDTITSREGLDTIGGGTGTDTLVLDWSASASGAHNTGSYSPTPNGSGGFDGGFFRNDIGGMSYTSIERFVISTGSAGDNITTASGDDIVQTNGGDDLVNVGSGQDQADGGSNADASRGIDGISANLSGATVAVLWDLEANTYTGPAGTSFTNFEYFGTVTTGSGNDILVTRNVSRADTVNAGAGNDTITSRDGLDSINGGADTDTLVLDWSASNSAAHNTGSYAPTANGSGGFNGGFFRSDMGGMFYTSIERFVVSTGGGADNITTASGDDVVNTGGGDDVVNFGAGNDSGDGGTGVDGFSADLSAVTTPISINLETGASLSFSNFEYIGTLTTGSGDDVIVTRNVNRAETINTGAGHDTITSRDGLDSINGGADTDTLVLDWSASNSAAHNTGSYAPTPNGSGGFNGGFFRSDLGGMFYTSIERFVVSTGGGADNITTASGADEIRTGAGTDTINAGAGNDYLDGGADADSMAGGAGDDVYIVDNASDAVTENANEGTDEIRTALASYSLAARPNVENLTGTGTVDQTLTGNSGNNVIDGGAGTDAMNGLGGDDIYVVGENGDVVNENANEGIDEIRTALASYTLASANVENLTGTSAAGQSLTGDANANTITGAGGNDVIDGKGGDDTMIGGSGNDAYVVDSHGDLITENANEGTDEVRTALASYSLGALANVENLTGTSAAGQTLNGNSENNVITGNSGSDSLGGNGGTDTLVGGMGDDGYHVDGAEDIVTEAAGEGNDTIYTSAASYTLTSANVENLWGTQATGHHLIGDANANRITGVEGNDTLDGNGGTDTLVGNTGNDIFIVDSADDVVIEQAGEGTADEVRTALTSYTLPDNVEILTITGSPSGPLVLRGNGGDNVMTGGSGNDFFYLQQGGDDDASGGEGNDVFLFGGAMTGADKVDGGPGNDQIALQGNYANLSFGPGVLGVESLVLLPGDETAFGDPGTNIYDYNITFADANADNITFVIDANRLRAGEDFTFNGAAEDDSNFYIYGGDGTDILTGGSGDDVFLYGFFQGSDSNYDPLTDQVTGGDGHDQMALRGNYTVTLGASAMTGVESLVLLSGRDVRANVDYHYDVTTVDANVGVGAELVVDGGQLRSGETLRFNGGDESNGTFRIFGGDGQDSLTGGSLGDTIRGKGGEDLLYGRDGADTLTGGAGNDSFLYFFTSQSQGGSFDTITDFASGDVIDLGFIDADEASGGNGDFTFIGAEEFSGALGELRAYEESPGHWFVEGNTAGDATPELIIEVYTTDGQPLDGSDFILAGLVFVA